jgi:hypothetical protein
LSKRFLLAPLKYLLIARAFAHSSLRKEDSVS